jgi:hypothetical protein
VREGASNRPDSTAHCWIAACAAAWALSAHTDPGRAPAYRAADFTANVKCYNYKRKAADSCVDLLFVW